VRRGEEGWGGMGGERVNVCHSRREWSPFERAGARKRGRPLKRELHRAARTRAVGDRPALAFPRGRRNRPSKSMASLKRRTNVADMSRREIRVDESARGGRFARRVAFHARDACATRQEEKEEREARSRSSFAIFDPMIGNRRIERISVIKRSAVEPERASARAALPAAALVQRSCNDEKSD
jgi:hypothetical protein